MFVQNFYLPFQNVYVGYVVGNMESTTNIGLCFYRIEYISDLKWTSVEIAVGTGMEFIFNSSLDGKC